ncbi:MAG: thermonuclease family protein [Phyllobacteriaceae bacterium]|nr:thermonuclease family protein [Phyllobacteriaceae bacterium]
MPKLPPCAALLVLLVWPDLVFAAEPPFPGPIEATVVRVVDGDTIKVDAHIWPGQTLRVSVRLRGVDAPEIKGKCLDERAAARRALAALEGLLAAGPVQLADIAGDKYYGRVIADLVTADGLRASSYLIGAGLARPYRGNHRAAWCAVP